MINKKRPETLSNIKGLTIVELLITISVGSLVIMMLMSILSSTLFTKNIVEHENRLKTEAYYISEYLQETIFDLGVRSIESEYITDEDGYDHEVLILRHEYEIIQSERTGIIRRDYDDQRTYILHHDHETQNLYYGPSESFSDNPENVGFSNRSNFRINDLQVNIEPNNNGRTLNYKPIIRGVFQGQERAAGAIIEMDLQLSFGEQDSPVFQPQSFYSTIVF